MAQDEYYYEIQLTNKQLVFYFMAGAAFLVMSFLAGIVVGRGVDSTAEATTVQTAPARVAAAPEEKDKIVTEESQTKSAANSAQDLKFDFDTEKKDYHLDRATGAPGTNANTKSAMADGMTAVPPGNIKPVTAASNASHPTAAPPAAKTAAVKVPPSVNAVAGASNGKTAVPVKPGPQAKATSAPPAPVAGGFTIQVGAFKDRASAESIVSRLKGKGFAAYVVTPDAGGLFNVRVGSFSARPQAEKIEARLRDDEKFKPFIVKQ